MASDTGKRKVRVIQPPPWPEDGCPWCWGSHGCDLKDGHEGDHICRAGHEEGKPSVRPRGHPQVFHFRTMQFERVLRNG